MIMEQFVIKYLFFGHSGATLAGQNCPSPKDIGLCSESSMDPLRGLIKSCIFNVGT